MANQIEMQAEPRTGAGKGAARKLRQAGGVPATLYGARRDPVSLTVSPKHVAAILHSESGQNTVFQLAVRGGETTAAMVVDWQRDPVKGRLLHVDLKRIAMDVLIRVRVPISVQGEAAGVKVQGGVLELVTREVEIECLPSDIPEHIDVDVSELTIGQNIRVGDLKVEGNRRVVTDADRVVAHVVSIKEVVEPTPAETAAATTPAEPEVIKKGKTEAAPEEGAEAAGKEKEKGEKKK